MCVMNLPGVDLRDLLAQAIAQSKRKRQTPAI
jgi:hypothetical protein